MMRALLSCGLACFCMLQVLNVEAVAGGCRSQVTTSSGAGWRVWIPSEAERAERQPKPVPPPVPLPALTMSAPQFVPIDVVVVAPQRQTVLQTVHHQVLTSQLIPVQTFESRVGVRQVVQNVSVRVQRPVTTWCQQYQASPGLVTTVVASTPVTQMVESVETRPQVVNETFTYQVPVTRYVQGVQAQQVVEYLPVELSVTRP